MTCVPQTTSSGVKTVDDSSGVKITEAGTTAVLSVDLSSPKMSVSMDGKKQFEVEWTSL